MKQLYLLLGPIWIWSTSHRFSHLLTGHAANFCCRVAWGEGLASCIFKSRLAWDWLDVGRTICKKGMRWVGTAIAQQGEVLASNQCLAIKTTFLVFRPWSLEHNLGERFQSHQDTLGSSGYSDSTPCGSRSAVETPRFKAFGTSSWFNLNYS